MEVLDKKTISFSQWGRIRGKQGGRKPKLDNVKKKAVYELYQQKKTSVKDICAMFDITKPTLYKVIGEISSKLTGSA